jgi:hypothetical protein
MKNKDSMHYDENKQLGNKSTVTNHHGNSVVNTNVHGHGHIK